MEEAITDIKWGDDDIFISYTNFVVFVDCLKCMNGRKKRGIIK